MNNDTPYIKKHFGTILLCVLLICIGLASAAFSSTTKETLVKSLSLQKNDVLSQIANTMFQDVKNFPKMSMVQSVQFSYADRISYNKVKVHVKLIDGTAADYESTDARSYRNVSKWILIRALNDPSKWELLTDGSEYKIPPDRYMPKYKIKYLYRMIEKAIEPMEAQKQWAIEKANLQKAS
ncbi:MAG: hypothetical protein RSD49_08005 [Hafnia sp.]